MKNKLFLGLGAIVLTFGIGTAVYAEANSIPFEDMLPFMKQMHPQATEQQLNDMYQSCHANNGGMMQNGIQNRSGMQGNGPMMRGYQGGSMMGNGQAGPDQNLQDFY